MLRRTYGLEGLTWDIAALQSIPQAMGPGQPEITVLVWQKKEIIGLLPGRVETCYGLAVDLGTTTIGGYLCELTTGEVVATASLPNPQATYGADIISRMAYAQDHSDGVEKLHRLVVEGINRLVQELSARAGLIPRHVVDGAVAGNSTMLHLFLGISRERLGRAPFAPEFRGSLDLKARDLGLAWSPGAYVHVLPLVGGFVGADTVAVVLSQETFEPGQATLLVDIGTNGELVFTDGTRFWTTSCAACPAFEGGYVDFGMPARPGAIDWVRVDPQSLEVRYHVTSDRASVPTPPSGLCGSGIIDAVAELVRCGVIEETGRFGLPRPSPRLRQSAGGQPEFVLVWGSQSQDGRDIAISQKDVRAVQLAKAAFNCAASVLMGRSGLRQIDRVLLAGSFGSRVDPWQIAQLGLLPVEDGGRIQPIGNAAGLGAVQALLDASARLRAQRLARQMEFVELASEQNFSALFTEALFFPGAIPTND